MLFGQKGPDEKEKHQYQWTIAYTNTHGQRISIHHFFITNTDAKHGFSRSFVCSNNDITVESGKNWSIFYAYTKCGWLHIVHIISISW
jgi:hypothetical protein